MTVGFEEGCVEKMSLWTFFKDEGEWMKNLTLCDKWGGRTLVGRSIMDGVGSCEFLGVTDPSSFIDNKNVTPNGYVGKYKMADKMDFKCFLNGNSSFHKKEDNQPSNNCALHDALDNVNNSLISVNRTLLRISEGLEEVLSKYSKEILSEKRSSLTDKHVSSRKPKRQPSERTANNLLEDHVTKKGIEKMCLKLRMDENALSKNMTAEEMKNLLDIRRMEYKMKLMEACFHTYEHLLNQNVLKYCTNTTAK
ncbi:hypothetical protein HELRODRAFT_172955 [Helobdella robusta]|uniref:Uncharacterized protein n=1 Tax=Helobdella robusta TaxID=6412 RepID=T1F673_HELRO|nr:hypothetical protein HELRODRAFT_172955 [Helobdella robusta]ESO03926.1 hypothetical protein HELRODRAFT_172955 [Helobdella robusta]